MNIDIFFLGFVRRGNFLKKKNIKVNFCFFFFHKNLSFALTCLIRRSIELKLYRDY